jgi:hypothetical protein
VDNGFRAVGAGSITVLIEGYSLGIRWNHPGLEDEIRALFAAHIVADDPEIPANISFKLAEPDSKVRGKTAVMMANRTMTITASEERALRAGVQLLDSEIRSGRAEPLIQAAPLVSDKGTILLDAHLRPRLRKLEPRLAKAGLHIVDTLGVRIDPETATVSIPEPCFDFDESVLEDLAESSRPDRAGGAIPDDPTNVLRWVMFRQGYLADLDSQAHNLLSTMPILRSRAGMVSASTIGALGHRLRSDEVRWVGGAIEDADLLAAITNDVWEPKEDS